MISEIKCDDCEEKIAAYDNGVIIVYPQKSADLHEIPVEWVFEAIRQGKGKGLLKLRDFVDEMHCIFG